MNSVWKESVRIITDKKQIIETVVNGEKPFDLKRDRYDKDHQLYSGTNSYFFVIIKSLR